MVSRALYEQFFNLTFWQAEADGKQFWRVDAEKFANYLEQIIRDDKNEYFTPLVAQANRASGLPGGSYAIHVTDGDFVRFFKSYINFVRALKNLPPNIIQAYINHLLSPPSRTNFIDGQVISVLKQAFSYRENFSVLYEHFLAFNVYLGGAIDLIWELPILSEHSPVTDKFREIKATFKLAYQQTNTKKGVDLLLAAKKKREDNAQKVLETHPVPQIEFADLSSALNEFGLHTHLQALSEMSHVLSASQYHKYYMKSTDSYAFEPLESISQADRNLMNAYNECGAAIRMMAAANADLLLIAKDCSEKRGSARCLLWKDLSVAKRAEYLRLNTSLQNLNLHLSRLEPLIKDIPELANILKDGKKYVLPQIAMLKKWDKSTACTSINILSGAINIEDSFNWAQEYVSQEITPAVKLQHYRPKKDLYRVDAALADNVKNAMLYYNINSRTRKAYKITQKIINEGFSFSDIGAADRLLYDIGHLIKEYRQVNSPDMVKKIKEKLETDYVIILNELTRYYHQLTAAMLKLETKQGLKTGFFSDKLIYLDKAFLKIYELNDQLPPEYKLALPSIENHYKYVMNTAEQIEQECQLEKKEQQQHASEQHRYLRYYSHRLASDHFELVDLIHILSHVRKLDGHHARVYADLLQSSIDQLLGVDSLERIIRAIEKQIKILMHDDFADLKPHLKNESIQKLLEELRKFYVFRAELHDIQANIERCKDSCIAMESIAIRHFATRSSTERLNNYAWSWLGYEGVEVHYLADGPNGYADINYMGRELSLHHSRVLKELDLVVHQDDFVPVEKSERVSYKDEIELTADHVAAVTNMNKDNETMLKNLINARKGFVILKLENLRKLILHYSKMAIHPAHVSALDGSQISGGVYTIDKSDSIIVVNVKAVHNVGVKVERVFEMINELADIPTHAKLATAAAIPSIDPVLSELKVRLNQFFAELEQLMEALTALVGCILSNTLHVFGNEALTQLIKLLQISKMMIDLYYDQPGHDKAPLQTKIESMISWLLSIDTDANVAIKQALQAGENAEIAQDVLDLLDLALSSSGQIQKDAHGYYDVAKLDDDSPLKNMAKIVNQHRLKNKNAQVEKSDDEDVTAQVSTKKIFQHGIKGVGDVVKHAVKANEIAKEIKKSHQAKTTPDKILIFLEQYLNKDGQVARLRDHSYDTRTLPNGSLKKCIAALLNIKEDIFSFTDSTVELANGRHFIGHIKVLNDLMDIRAEIQEADMVNIINDTFLQYGFDAKMLNHKINELIAQALDYLYPKIIDIIAQARIAEHTLGLNDDALLKVFEVALDQFIYLGQVFADGKFDSLKKDFPYDKRTLELTHSEMLRLKRLNIDKPSKHNFLSNGIKSLETFAIDLKKIIDDKAKKDGNAPTATAKPVAAPEHQPNAPITTEPPVPATVTPSVASDEEEVDIALPAPQPAPVIQPPAPARIDDLGIGLNNVMSDIKKEINDDVNLKIENAAAAKIIKLSEATINYKIHLAREIACLTLGPDGNPTLRLRDIDFTVPYQKPTGAGGLLSLTIDKFNAIDELQQTIKIVKDDPQDSALKVANFNRVLKLHTPLLSTRRDSNAITFWKVMATIFTLGIAAAFGLWKPKGETYCQNTTKITIRPSA